jgi:DNA-binding MarR family transcriptional regulator
METESGSPLLLEAHLGYWLRKVSNAVSGSFAKALRRKQISVAEWVLLCNLQSREQATPGDLADALQMTRGAISKIIDKLEAKQWIKSRVNPEDNRIQMLSLTSSGRRVIPELAKIADENDHRYFACLHPGERQTLRDLLKKLADVHEIGNIPWE